MGKHKKLPDQTVSMKGPRIPIDWEKVDLFLQAHCNGEEIAARMGFHPDTLYHRCVAEKGMKFSAYRAIKQADGKALLRYSMMRKALSGDGKMLIHLAEQLLDQTAKSKVEHAGSITIQRVDYTTAQLADHQTSDAISEDVSDACVELSRQGGQESGYCVAPTSGKGSTMLELSDH